MKLFDKFGHEIKKTCIYCNFRHSCDKSENEIEKVFETKNCNDFIPGKCFTCKDFLAGVNRNCDDVFYPQGCKNYKKGDLDE